MANVYLSVRRTVGNSILFTVPDRQTFVMRAVWLNVTTGRAYIRVTGPGLTPFDIIGLDTYTVSIPDPAPPPPEEPPTEERHIIPRHHKVTKAEPEHPEPKTEPTPRGMTTSTPQAIYVELDYMEFRAGTVITLDLDASGATVSAGIQGSTST